MRRTIGALILLVLTACGAAVATGEGIGGDGSTTTRPTYPNYHTTTTAAPTTTLETTTTLATTTTGPVITPFGVNVTASCPAGQPKITINFPNNPPLNGQTGVLDFSDGTSFGPLTYASNSSLTIDYPASHQSPLTLTYRIQGQTATATVTYPCAVATTTTTTLAGTTTTAATTTTTAATTTTVAGSTTTTTAPPPGATTTTLPATFSFSGASTVCRSEVPTIVIDFATPGFPSLAGQTGILTMSDVNGNVVSTQPLVYQPGGHVELLYPGTVVNADGSIADVPGWNLTNAGLWVRDPSDEFLREGIQLSYTVNPTATAFITYPPESSACANPENPPRPGQPRVPTTTTPGLPHTK